MIASFAKHLEYLARIFKRQEGLRALADHQVATFPIEARPLFERISCDVYSTTQQLHSNDVPSRVLEGRAHFFNHQYIPPAHREAAAEYGQTLQRLAASRRMEERLVAAIEKHHPTQPFDLATFRRTEAMAPAMGNYQERLAARAVAYEKEAADRAAAKVLAAEAEVKAFAGMKDNLARLRGTTTVPTEAVRTGSSWLSRVLGARAGLKLAGIGGAVLVGGFAVHEAGKRHRAEDSPTERGL